MSIAADRRRPRDEGRASIRSQFSADLALFSPVGRRPSGSPTTSSWRSSRASLCRCKCVSKHWLGFIHHPDHRKRLPQTLAGFFYSSSTTEERLLESPFNFTSLSGDRRPPFDTSLTFLPGLLDSCNGNLGVDLLDSCNRWHDVSADAFHYVVCNPATEKWVVLPNSGKASSKVATTCLGFDPALSSHFHVFELVQEFKYGQNTDLSGVAVYSSETGGWVYKEKRWNGHTWLATRHSSATVFLDGLLFFHAFDLNLDDCVAAVDTTGETWIKSRVPGGQLAGSRLFDGFIQLSQGCLHYANFQRDEDGVAIRLLVYVLENYQGEQWILKHSIETSNISGWTDFSHGGDFELIAIHPESNLVFFAVDGITFMCYNMDSRQVKVISYLPGVKPPFLPYVPLYTELQSLHI